MKKQESIISPLISSLIKFNPDSGDIGRTFELLIKQIMICHPKLTCEVVIFNQRKSQTRNYYLMNQSLISKTEPLSKDQILKESEFTSYIPSPLLDKFQFPLIKDKHHIGYLVSRGLSNPQEFASDLIFASHFFIRALLANEKKLAIDSLVELNNELEVIVEDKTVSLLKEKEANFHSSKMATLGEIAAGVAHEINNPLTIIQAKILTMEKKLDKKNKLDLETSEDFKKMLGTVERITKIVKGLRFVSRDGGSDPEVKVSLSQLFQTTLDLCGERLKNNHVEYRINFRDSDFELEVKDTQIVQVFLNLINNSFDAVKKLENKWIHIDCRDEDGKLNIHFIDSGSGIPEENILKLMAPFFTTKPAGQGTGLGLSISKGIIEKHYGKITYNKDNKNTDFVIELPYVRKLSLNNSSSIWDLKDDKIAS